MRYDSYSRFLKSQLYKDCIMNEMEGKPLIQQKTTDKRTTSSPQITNKKNINTKSSLSHSPSLKSLSHASNFIGSPHQTEIVLSPDSNCNKNNPFPLSSSSLNNMNTNQAGCSLSSADSQSLNRKEKKRSTILPWTKGIFFIHFYS